MAFASIGSLKGSRLGFDGAAFTKDDASSDLDHSSSLTLLMNLSIPEIRRGNTVRLARPPWPSRRFGLFPLTKEFQEDLGIMLEGIRSKQWKRPIQTPLDLSEESAGIIKIAIPNQRSQAETKLGYKGSPDPGGSEASASSHLWERRFLGIIDPRGFWCFF